MTRDEATTATKLAIEARQDARLYPSMSVFNPTSEANRLVTFAAKISRQLHQLGYWSLADSIDRA